LDAALSVHGAGAAACGGVDLVAVASPVQTIVNPALLRGLGDDLIVITVVPYTTSMKTKGNIHENKGPV
jgi:hypothetical protein